MIQLISLSLLCFSHTFDSYWGEYTVPNGSVHYHFYEVHYTSNTFLPFHLVWWMTIGEAHYIKLSIHYHLMRYIKQNTFTEVNAYCSMTRESKALSINITVILNRVSEWLRSGGLFLRTKEYVLCQRVIRLDWQVNPEGRTLQPVPIGCQFLLILVCYANIS